MKYFILLIGLPVMFLFNNCTSAEFEQQLPSIFDQNANGFEVPEEELEELPNITDNNGNNSNNGSGNENEEGTVTVSYTHLTLPTICSV